MALPPNLIIQLGKWFWTTEWHLMMSRLAPRSKSGEYIRPESEFRQWLGQDSDYPAESGRYRLYVGLTCPWAHRTLVVRTLKGLEAVIEITVATPSASAGGWLLKDDLNNCSTLRELYQLARPGYQGRCTVPVLWDQDRQTIVNNESSEIIVMLNSQFNQWARYPQLDLYPEAVRSEIELWNEKIYHHVNNGVYRCGFAQTQIAYEQAVTALFTTLDEIDTVLATNRYLCGNQLTLADVRLFTTLLRFDIAYYGLFKCDRRRIQDYPHLSGYLREIYQLPGIATTSDLEAIKQDYYGNLFPLNPGGIIPMGQDLSYLLNPHNREHLVAK